MAEVLQTFEEESFPAVLCVGLSEGFDSAFYYSVGKVAQVNSAEPEGAILELDRKRYTMVVIAEVCDPELIVATAAQRRNIPCAIISDVHHCDRLSQPGRTYLSCYDHPMSRLSAILMGILPPHPNT